MIYLFVRFANRFQRLYNYSTNILLHKSINMYFYKKGLGIDKIINLKKETIG
jgi:hypothetical protein